MVKMDEREFKKKFGNQKNGRITIKVKKLFTREERRK